MCGSLEPYGVLFRVYESKSKYDLLYTKCLLTRDIHPLMNDIRHLFGEDLTLMKSSVSSNGLKILVLQGSNCKYIFMVNEYGYMGIMVQNSVRIIVVKDEPIIILDKTYDKGIHVRVATLSIKDDLRVVVTSNKESSRNRVFRICN